MSDNGVEMERLSRAEHLARIVAQRLYLAFIDGKLDPPAEAHRDFVRLADAMGYTVERKG